MFTVFVFKNKFKMCFVKNVPELFTFLPSLLAALFPIKLPSIRTKCCLRQYNFSNFSEGGSPRLLYKLTPACGAR